MFKTLSAAALTIGTSMAPAAFAADQHAHSMLEACKAQCPTAKTEDETHKCLEALPKKKKSEKAFKDSECFHAYQEHEKAEKSGKHGHKH